MQKGLWVASPHKLKKLPKKKDGVESVKCLSALQAQLQWTAALMLIGFPVHSMYAVLFQLPAHQRHSL